MLFRSPGGYRSFTVHDPKRRRISAAPFRDRVAHHALMNIIGPLFERQFIYDTYANRVGKGTHAALDRCTYFMRRYRYVLPCDIKQFFPSIDHAILRETLTKTIGDRRTMSLCERIIASGAGILDDEYDVTYFPNDDLFAASRQRGLSIGNLTSQFWANVYLGFIVFPDHRRLKPRKGYTYRRHLRTLLQKFRAAELPRDKVEASVKAWVGHVQHGDTWGLRSSVLGKPI